MKRRGEGGRREKGKKSEGRERGKGTGKGREKEGESCLPSVSIIATEALGPMNITSLPLTYCTAALNHSVGSRSGFDRMVVI